MADILKLFNQRVVLDYVNNRQYPALLGETLMPERKIESLEFDYLKAGSRIPVIATLHAFDTEAEIASREASKSAGELGFIKRKMQLKEKDLIALRNPRTAAEQAYLEQLVYNDVDTLVNGVRARIEMMRMDAIANGQVTIDENNLDFVVSYDIPTDHQATLTGTGLWTDDNSDPIADIQNWSKTLDITPTRALTSNDVLIALLRHPLIRDMFKTLGMLPSTGNLNQIMTSMGLPTIVTYDAKYRKQNADGTYTRNRYFPSHKFVMFGDELLGETIYGPTPEESRLLSTGSNDTKVGNVFATIYESNLDPIGTWTKACATAMPSFPGADDVFQAAVIAEEV